MNSIRKSLLLVGVVVAGIVGLAGPSAAQSNIDEAAFTGATGEVSSFFTTVVGPALIGLTVASVGVGIIIRMVRKTKPAVTSGT